MCSHTVQNHGFQVHDGNMPFQSRCEAKIQAVRAHTCVAMDLPYPLVTILTRPCHYKHSVLPSVVRPSVPFLSFQGTWHSFVERTELRLDVTTPVIQQCTVVQHGLVSQWFPSSPEKPGEPHAYANSEYQALFSNLSSSWEQGYYASDTTLDINIIVHYASPIWCELYGHEYIHMAGQSSVKSLASGK